MDERMARKVGEVKAFTILGIELFEKGKTALEKSFGSESVVTTVQSLHDHLNKIDEEMSNTNFLEIMNQKAEKTKTKVGGMAETYIGDAWDDATELCEWLGFFEGAALVHFALVSSFAEKANLPGIVQLAEEGVSLHTDLLEKVKTTIKTLA